MDTDIERTAGVAWTLDLTTGRFLDVSPDVVALLGFSAEEILSGGTAPLDAFGMCTLLTRKRVQALMSGRAPPGRLYVDEVEQSRKDGSRVRTEVINSYSVNPRNGHIEVRGLTRDIEARKRVEAARSNVDWAAGDATRAAGQCLGEIGDALRTPITTIVRLTDRVLHTKLGREQRACLQGIKAASSGLLDILDEIPDPVRIEAGRRTPERTGFSPARLLDRVARVIGPQARRKGLSLVTRVAPETPPHLIGDPRRLNRILVHLTSRAVTRTEQGEIRVVVAPDAASRNASPDAVRVRFRIEDSYPGTHADESTEPLGPIDGHIRGTEPGGSAMCEELVSSMGGEIRVEGDAGRGSIVSFAVDLGIGAVDVTPSHRRGDAARSVGPAGSNGRPTLAGHRILVVEDNAINRELVIAWLADLGILAEWAGNGREAVARVAVEPFDWVLMDVQMPELDGLSATRMIRARGLRDLPIIALTAPALASEKDDCLDAGMNDHLPKPIDAATLADTLQRWLPNPARPRRSEPRPPADPASAPSPSPGIAEPDPGPRPVWAGMPMPSGVDALELGERFGAKPELLLRLLRSFAKSCPGLLATLEAAVAGSDPDDANRSLHALRGMAANLAMPGVAAAAADFERALARGDRSRLPGCLAALSETLEPILEALTRDLCPTEVSPPPPLTPTEPRDRSTAERLLHRLGDLVDQADMRVDETFAALKAALGPGSWSPRIDELERQIDRLDWEAARESVDRLIEILARSDAA